MALCTRKGRLSRGKITGYVATDVDNYLTAKRQQTRDYCRSRSRELRASNSLCLTLLGNEINSIKLGV